MPADNATEGDLAAEDEGEDNPYADRRYLWTVCGRLLYFGPIFAVSLLLSSAALAITIYTLTRHSEWNADCSQGFGFVIAAGCFISSYAPIAGYIYYRWDIDYGLLKKFCTFLMVLGTYIFLFAGIYVVVHHEGCVGTLWQFIIFFFSVLCIISFGLLPPYGTLLVLYLMGSPTFWKAFRCCNKPAHSPTRMITSESHPHHVDFLLHPLPQNLPGDLGICLAPGRKKFRWQRDLQADLERIRNHYKVDVLVTLLAPRDIADINVPDLFTRAQALGLETIHYPIRDKWIPERIDTFMQLVRTIISRLREGKRVVVHCNGGKGRSGLVVVAVLLELGASLEEAITRVREARSGTIRNPLQIMYGRHVQRMLAREHARAIRDNKVELLPTVMSSSDVPMNSTDSRASTSLTSLLPAAAAVKPKQSNECASESVA